MTDLRGYYDGSYPPSLWAPVPPAPLVLTSVTPSSAVVDSGSVPVTLVGSGFTASCQVSVDGAPPVAATYVSATELTSAINTDGATPSTFGLVVVDDDRMSSSRAFTLTAALPEDVEHYTVDAVKAHVTEHPDDAQAVLDAELARGDAARSTLVTWLQGHASE